jgi:DNA-binding phage protein
MRKLRTLDEVTEAYFRDHPEEIDDYLTEILQDFAEDNDTGTLLSSLRVLDLVRDISNMTAQGLQTALSAQQIPLS